MVDESRPRSRRALLAAAGTAVAASQTGCLGLAKSPAERLSEHESALEPLADPAAAAARGYLRLAPYATRDAGSVGVPAVDESVVEVTPETPHAVLFDLTDEGAFEPLGLKWLVPAADVESAPSLFGTAFDGPIDPATPTLPRHYALHAWLFQDNPEGTFARANPAVDPPAFLDALAPAWTAVGEFEIGQAAVDAGYRNTEQCIATDAGGYGVPFVDTRDTEDRATRPPVLLYRVTENWSYRLLGAEWFVPVDGADGPPARFGQSYHERTAGHSPETDQPAHFGLHAWLAMLNPDGLFAPFNPVVQC